MKFEPVLETRNNKQENNILLKEVAELEEPVKKIIEQIRERIEKGEYGLIIGEDASGRIPTKILGGFISEISKIRGLPTPDIIFIPGKFNAENDVTEKFEKHISKYNIKGKERTLIITEAIQTGGSLKVLCDLLKNLHFEVDIATVGMESNSSYAQKGIKENLEEFNIFSGDYTRQRELDSTHTPLVFYGKGRTMSGVRKDRGVLKSQPIKSRVYPAYRDKVEIQQNINESRKEANTLVDRLVEWYLNKNK